MPNCELTLTFDRPNLTYHFGEQVSGTVGVHVNSEYQCHQLVLEWNWTTHGRGSQDLGVSETLKLFEGNWNPGMAYEYPFSFPAPSGPATYHGHDLNVDWYVRARVNDPLSGSKVEQEILLIPRESFFWDGPGPRAPSLGPAYRDPGANWICETVRPGVGALLGAKALLLLAVLAAIAFLFRSTAPALAKSPNPIEAVLGLIGVLFFLEPLQLFIGDWKPRIGSMRFVYSGVVVVLFMIILLLMAVDSPMLADLVFGGAASLVGLDLLFRSRRQCQLGEILVNIQPTVATRGDGIVCAISLLRFRARTEPQVRASLIAREYTYVSFQTGGVFIPRHLVFEKECQLAQVQPNGTRNKSWQTLVRIPEDAPPTFSSSYNRLAWEIVLRVGANDIPNWSSSYPVTVYP